MKNADKSGKKIILKFFTKKTNLFLDFFSVVCLNPIGCFNEKSKNKTKKKQEKENDKKFNFNGWRF